MSLLIYPVFESKLKTPKPKTSGEFLAQVAETLDRIAKRNRITLFNAFTDQREIPADFDGPPWELDDALGPCTDWYSAGDGRKAFLELAKAIRKGAPLTKQLESPNEVVDELEDLARILGAAEKAGVKFRLAIS